MYELCGILFLYGNAATRGEGGGCRDEFLFAASQGRRVEEYMDGNMHANRGKTNKSRTAAKAVCTALAAVTVMLVAVCCGKVLNVGVRDMLDCDLDMRGIVESAGITLPERRGDTAVSGGAAVEMFYPPVEGEICAHFEATGSCTQYICGIISTVRTPCGGKVSDVFMLDGGYGVCIEAAGGIRITLRDMTRVLVKSGQSVSGGQIIGSAGSSGEIRVEALKNGEAVDFERLLG